MATKGQAAQIMAGADDVEIKATIPDHQVEVAMRRYDLEQDDNERYIYFFDTPDLQLFQAGVIGRARRVVGGVHDSTIKFRPVDPAAVPTVSANSLRTNGLRDGRLTHRLHRLSVCSQDAETGLWW